MDFVEDQTDSPSRPFAAMVEHIGRNDPARFGGAFVVVPPKGGGDVFETLILDPHQAPAQFWSTLRTKIDLELAKLDELQRQQRAFGR